MKLSSAKGDRLFGIIMLAFGVIMILIIPSQIKMAGSEWYDTPRTFPYIICILMAICGLRLFLKATVKIKKEAALVKEQEATPNKISEEKEGEEGEFSIKRFKTVLISLVAIMVYLVLLDLVGYYIPCTIALLAVMMIICGQKNYIKIGIVSVAIPLIIYYSFTNLLSIRLP